MTKNTKMKMQYLGVLSLLAQCSVKMRDTGMSEVAADDLRDCIADALTEAQRLIPELRWKRVLDRFDVELVDEPDEWPGEKTA